MKININEVAEEASKYVDDVIAARNAANNAEIRLEGFVNSVVRNINEEISEFGLEFRIVYVDDYPSPEDSTSTQYQSNHFALYKREGENSYLIFKEDFSDYLGEEKYLHVLEFYENQIAIACKKEQLEQELKARKPMEISRPAKAGKV